MSNPIDPGVHPVNAFSCISLLSTWLAQVTSGGLEPSATRTPIPTLAAQLPADAPDDLAAPPDAPLSVLAVVPGGLTADAVAARAAATSFDVRARLAEQRAALAEVAQARAAFLPQLSGVARYTRLSDITLPALGNLVVAPAALAGPVAPGTQLQAVPFTFPVILNQYTAQGTLAVPLSDYILRLPQAFASARARARGAAYATRATQATSALNGRITFYGWAKARWQVLVARQTLKQAQGRLADAEKAADVGSASRADLLRLRSQVAEAQTLVTRTEALAGVFEQQLRVALHGEAPATFELGEDVQPEVRSAAVAQLLAISDEDVLYREALSQRLEIKAMEAATRGLREQAKAVRSAGLPRLDAVANAIYANPNPRFIPQQEKWNGTWDATVQLSWTPTALFGSERQKEALLRQADANEAQRGALEDTIRVEVAQALGALKEAHAAQKSAAQGLEAAEEGYRVRKLLADNGRATTIELVDAESDLLRARLDLIAARLDARTGLARVEHALGRDLEAVEATPVGD